MAEKGGVCALIGELCCTYIPDHTGANGSFTRAMIKLKSLGQEVRKEKASHGKDCIFRAGEVGKIRILGCQGWGSCVDLGILMMIVLFKLLHSFIPTPGDLTTPLHCSCDPRHRIQP